MSLIDLAKIGSSLPFTRSVDIVGLTGIFKIRIGLCCKKEEMADMYGATISFSRDDLGKNHDECCDCEGIISSYIYEDALLEYVDSCIKDGRYPCFRIVTYSVWKKLHFTEERRKKYADVIIQLWYIFNGLHERGITCFIDYASRGMAQEFETNKVELSKTKSAAKIT